MGKREKMNNRLLGLLLGSMLVMQLAGCVEAPPLAHTGKPTIKNVAVISIAVDADAELGMGTKTKPVRQLVASTLDSVVKTTEAKLSGIFHVTRISGFIDNPNYQNLAAEKETAFLLPEISGKRMIVFSAEADDVKDGLLSREVAIKLCYDLKVDAVALVYSDWTTQRVHIVSRERKAYVESTVTVWDSNGEMVFKKRVGVMGENTLGVAGFGVKSGSLKEWSTAYGKSLDDVVDELKKLAK
jgi:hypothetical protein